MVGRYERVRLHLLFLVCLPRPLTFVLQVNAHDEDEPETPVTAVPRHAIPNSPPPSFHSRASSLERRRRVDPTLADAFGTDGDDSDDEADDRQRLVRGNSSSAEPGSSRTPSSEGAGPTEEPEETRLPAAAGASSRVYGGGIQADGVFSNLTAKPDRGAEKEEQPPVCAFWSDTVLP